MAKKLKDIWLREVSLVDKGANPEAHILLFKRAMKQEGDERLPSSAYAYVPDAEKPSTWKLRIDDARHVGAAAAALGPGYRGQKVSIPAADRSKVIARVRAAWRKFHPDAEPEDMPEVLRKGSLLDLIKAMDFDEASAQRDMMTELSSLMDVFWQKYDALQESIRSVMVDDDVEDKRSAIRNNLEQFSNWIRENLPDVEKRGHSMTIEELEKKLADQETRIAGLEGDLKEANTKLSASEAEVAKLKGESDQVIDKSALPEEVRKHLEEQEAKAAELEKRAAENEVALKKLQEERAHDQLKAEVAKDYPNLPDHDGIAKVLASLEGDNRETFTKTLIASNKGMGSALSTVGASGEGVDGHAYEEATRKAEKLMADNPGKYKSLPAARNEIWKSDSDLLKRYQDERKSSH